MIDDEHADRPLRLFQPQSKLFLDRRERGRADARNRWL
jgi:hypothetical protein